MPKSISAKPRKAKAFSLLLVLVGAGTGWFFLKQREESAHSEPTVILHRFQTQKPLMGTMVTVTAYAESKEKADAAFANAFARAAEVDQVASDYLPDSELALFNAAKTNAWVPASDDLLTMVAYGLELAELTNGAYDPTLGTITHLWRVSKEAGKLPSAEVRDQARELSGWKLVEVDLDARKIRKLKVGVRLDLGGLGKGYAADMMLEALLRNKISSALITFGGDVRCGEAPPGKNGWMVGLNDYQNKIVATMTVSDCAVSTSGDLQQFIEIDGRRYSHVVEPATGLGTTDSLLATVVANNGLMADPLATAACINPTLFGEISPSTNIHSRILSEDQQQLSSGFPPLEPYTAEE